MNIDDIGLRLWRDDRSGNRQSSNFPPHETAYILRLLICVRSFDFRQDLLNLPSDYSHCCSNSWCCKCWENFARLRLKLSFNHQPQLGFEFGFARHFFPCSSLRRSRRLVARVDWNLWLSPWCCACCHSQFSIFPCRPCNAPLTTNFHYFGACESFLQHLFCG